MAHHYLPALVYVVVAEMRAQKRPFSEKKIRKCIKKSEGSMEYDTAQDKINVNQLNTVALLIVKNEERTIKRCIDSISGKFDEIIIVDTGSTDNTINIIIEQRVLNLKLLNFKWTESFADARNYALNNSKGKYVFFIDADEVLKSDRKEILKKLPELAINDEINLNVICPKIVDHDENYTTGVPRFFLMKMTFTISGMFMKN
jgi:glycosyltransferase involved in cell wall biosynthesis